MNRIYFVRHAQTDYTNPIDAIRPLTKEGLEDRYMACTFLEEQGLLQEVTRVYSSDFIRAIDTVKPFAQRAGLEVLIQPAFHEWSIIADAKEYYRACKLAFSDFTYQYGDSETMEQVQQRFSLGVENILKDYRDGTFVVGTHGTALSAYIRKYNPDFDYEELMRIMEIKPWIVRFDFQGTTFMGYEEVYWHQT